MRVHTSSSVPLLTYMRIWIFFLPFSFILFTYARGRDMLNLFLASYEVMPALDMLISAFLIYLFSFLFHTYILSFYLLRWESSFFCFFSRGSIASIFSFFCPFLFLLLTARLIFLPFPFILYRMLVEVASYRGMSASELRQHIFLLSSFCCPLFISSFIWAICPVNITCHFTY